MGSRYNFQGKCIECGRYTHDYCDHCGRYLCEEHRFIKHPKHGKKEFVFCEGCYKKNRKPIDPECRNV
ncbi:MAG: hypothetical protein ACOCZ6_01905 [Nanoarchaeota archaeon]